MRQKFVCHRLQIQSFDKVKILLHIVQKRTVLMSFYSIEK